MMAAEGALDTVVVRQEGSEPDPDEAELEAQLRLVDEVLLEQADTLRELARR